MRALAAHDIRPAQFSVLVVIEADPGLSQADLADTLGIERARLVRLLDGLGEARADAARGLARGPALARPVPDRGRREGARARQGARRRARGAPDPAARPREARRPARGAAGVGVISSRVVH